MLRPKFWTDSMTCLGLAQGVPTAEELHAVRTWAVPFLN